MKINIAYIKRHSGYSRKNQLKSFAYFFLVICISSCIEEFTPAINEGESFLVVDGSIVKENSIQQIIITRTGSINNPEFIPEKSCYVTVIDNLGNEFVFSEGSPGIYKTNIPEQYLAYGRSFKISIITPDNNIYESGFESLLPSSPIDGIYYIPEKSQNSGVSYTSGLQFYTDLKAPEGATKYYRWILEECYEYHSKYPARLYFTPATGIIFQPDTLKVCWKDSEVLGFYSSSTENLSVNAKKKIPLNYVPVQSEKLNVKYSLLVKQFSLSESAYRYWNQNKVVGEESGGLYQVQPSVSISNISNINDPTEDVLGYFWASSYTEKRIFFDGPLDHEYFIFNCKLDTFDFSDEQSRWLLHIGDDGPVPIYGYSNEECFDCTSRGGTTEQPDYWE